MYKQQMTVIGGGLLGSAIAYGAAREGLNVRVLDQGDTAHRASRGNFGLIWLHGKGNNHPEYVRWTKGGLKLWPELQKELFDLTGVDSGLEQLGGFWFGFSDKEVQDRAEKLESINCAGGDVPFEMMDAKRLKEFFPELGSAVVGGSYCPLDGQANPLMLMRALQAAMLIKGIESVSNVDVATIDRGVDTGTFNIVAKDGQSWKSDRVVLAAGLGNAALASQVGLHAAIKPTRGQVLITERMKPFLDYPTNKCRQTKEGSVQLGSTSEQVGYDDSTSPDKIEFLARRAVDTFPILGHARMVRAWGALRPL
ncbi:NAD(P)/FAD-dependent oxidoreductase, partial [Roseobacter sp. GAI101]|uniref:NAD(P)/FAD-dependent oxidoreductase n=1 Tax=Roseobacter sp. (strain GAI101) TaxID=391589 RepID=UPI0005690013